jgi:hypothetical protein
MMYVPVLQTATSLLSVHPLQDTQGISLECEAQRFHSASGTTLQLGKGWHCYVRNGSTEMKWKKLHGQYTELSSTIADTLHLLCEQDSVPLGWFNKNLFTSVLFLVCAYVYVGGVWQARNNF